MNRIVDALPLEADALDTEIVTGLNLETQHLVGEQDLIVLEFAEVDGRPLILDCLDVQHLCFARTQAILIAPCQTQIDRGLDRNAFGGHPGAVYGLGTTVKCGGSEIPRGRGLKHRAAALDQADGAAACILLQQLVTLQVRGKLHQGPQRVQCGTQFGLDPNGSSRIAHAQRDLSVHGLGRHGKAVDRSITRGLDRSLLFVAGPSRRRFPGRVGLETGVDLKGFCVRDYAQARSTLQLGKGVALVCAPGQEPAFECIAARCRHQQHQQYSPNQGYAGYPCPEPMPRVGNCFREITPGQFGIDLTHSRLDESTALAWL